MREILFKAKRIDNGEWVEGSLLQTTAVSLKSFIVESACYTFGKWDWNNCIEVDKDTICQYTGLNDKNGQKIWENDIVKVGWQDNEAQAEEIQKVTWSKHGYYPWLDEYSCDGCDLFNEIMFVEVIGNIFDNPELLNE